MTDFEKGKIFTPGRARGSRNKLAHKVLEDLARIWDEPVMSGSDIRRGEAALKIMSKQDPTKFVQVYASLIPRELTVSDPTTADLTDEQIDLMISTLRQQINGSPVLMLTANKSEVIN